MTEARQRIIRALNETQAAEQDLAHVLQSQIEAAPRGRYRKGLHMHLRETRDHARRIEARLSELERRGNAVQIGIRMLESAVGQGFAMGRAPFELLAKAPRDLLRGSGGPEKVLEDAKDACATEALEIATYTGIEGLATSSGDRQTAKLAASIRADEQRMLEHLLDEIPSLVNWVMDAQVRGKVAPTIADNGGAGARTADSRVRKTAAKTNKGTRRKAARARKVTTTPRAGRRITRARPRLAGSSPRAASATPRAASATPRVASSRPRAASSTPRAAGSTPRAPSSTPRAAGSTPRAASSTPRAASASPRPAGRITGAMASETQLPIGNYETLSADQVLQKLGALSQTDLAKIDSFERQRQNRSLILSRIAALRSGEASRRQHEPAAEQTGSVLGKDAGEREVPAGLYGGMRESRDSMLEATKE